MSLETYSGDGLFIITTALKLIAPHPDSEMSFDFLPTKMGGMGRKRLPVSHSRASLQPGLLRCPAKLGTRSVRHSIPSLRYQTLARLIIIKATTSVLVSQGFSSLF
ncbi:MAG: hypothetical protein HYX41_01855 [Bdellovibrio sp.]|nr:hypothetical protein [Bdellovibrio sp.]